MFDWLYVFGHRVAAFLGLLLAFGCFGTSLAVGANTTLFGRVANPGTNAAGFIGFFIIGVLSLVYAWREIRVANELIKGKQIERAKRKHDEYLAKIYDESDFD